MSSPVRNIAVPSLLFAIVLFQSATSNVFFPVETNHEDLVHYRSLKDILFRSQSEAEETAHSIASPVVLAGFRPANPSPTLASPPHTGVGVSKIRFLEADEFFIPSLFPPITHPEFLPPAPTIQTEGRRANAQNSAAVDPTALVRQAKSANSSAVDDISVADSVQDRWPWPYSKPIKQQSAANVQTRQLQKPVPTLVVKKSVAKPYRLLTRTSTCPKLLHDLTITCAFPNQQPLSQPVEFQWYKTQHRNVATQNNLVDSTIKIPIAFGTQMIYKDSRYGVSAVSNSAALSIRQLKPQDCGSYICEALDARNATVLSTSEFLIFLCY